MKLSFRKDGDAWLDEKKKKKKKIYQREAVLHYLKVHFSLPTHFLFGSLYLLMWLIESRRFKGTFCGEGEVEILGLGVRIVIAFGDLLWLQREKRLQYLL